MTISNMIKTEMSLTYGTTDRHEVSNDYLGLFFLPLHVIFLQGAIHANLLQIVLK